MNEFKRDMMQEPEGTDTLIRPETAEQDVFAYLDEADGSKRTPRIVKYLFTKDEPDGSRKYRRMIFRRGEEGKLYRITEDYLGSAEKGIGEWFSRPVPPLLDDKKWEEVPREEPPLEDKGGFTRSAEEPGQEGYIQY